MHGCVCGISASVSTWVVALGASCVFWTRGKYQLWVFLARDTPRSRNYRMLYSFFSDSTLWLFGGFLHSSLRPIRACGRSSRLRFILEVRIERERSDRPEVLVPPARRISPRARARREMCGPLRRIFIPVGFFIPANLFRSNGPHISRRTRPRGEMRRAGGLVPQTDRCARALSVTPKYRRKENLEKKNRSMVSNREHHPCL